MTPEQIDDIWWGDINIGIDEDTFMIVRERALDYLNICETLYVTDAFAGWEGFNFWGEWWGLQDGAWARLPVQELHPSPSKATKPATSRP